MTCSAEADDLLKLSLLAVTEELVIQCPSPLYFIVCYYSALIY